MEIFRQATRWHHEMQIMPLVVPSTRTTELRLPECSILKRRSNNDRIFGPPARVTNIRLPFSRVCVPCPRGLELLQERRWRCLCVVPKMPQQVGVPRHHLTDDVTFADTTPVDKSVCRRPGRLSMTSLNEPHSFFYIRAKNNFVLDLEAEAE